MNINERDIREALVSLDPENDEHWTKAGLPAIPAVAAIAGEGVTRAMIVAVAPEFTREEPTLPPAPAGAAERSLADSATIRVDPTPTPAEPFEPTAGELAAAGGDDERELDDAADDEAAHARVDESGNPGPADGGPALKVAALEKRNAELESALSRADAEIRRLQAAERRRGGSRLDQALRTRPRRHPLLARPVAGSQD